MAKQQPLPTPSGSTKDCRPKPRQSHGNTNSNSHHSEQSTESSSESDSSSAISSDSDELDRSNNGDGHKPSKGVNSSASSSKKERKTTKGRRSGYNMYFGVRCKEIQRNDPNLEFATTISRNIAIEWNYGRTSAKQRRKNGMESPPKTTKSENKRLKGNNKCLVFIHSLIPFAIIRFDAIELEHWKRAKTKIQWNGWR